VGLIWCAFLNGDDVAAAVGIKIDHALHAALAFALHDHVGQQQRERFVADDLAGTPDGVAEAKRLLLTGEADRTSLGKLAGKQCHLRLLAALAQSLLELEMDIEVVFDDVLVTAGDENEMLDTRFQSFVDHILNDGLVDDSQHLLRHGLGGRKKASPETRNRKYSFSNFFMLCHTILLR
jgi:hypothetical protein